MLSRHRLWLPVNLHVLWRQAARGEGRIPCCRHLQCTAAGHHDRLAPAGPCMLRSCHLDSIHLTAQQLPDAGEAEPCLHVLHPATA